MIGKNMKPVPNLTSRKAGGLKPGKLNFADMRKRKTAAETSQSLQSQTLIGTSLVSSSLEAEGQRNSIDMLGASGPSLTGSLPFTAGGTQLYEQT